MCVVVAKMQMGGGGAVPLSRALCCRPCLPTSLPDLPGKAVDDDAVAIVSIGCHGSTGGGAFSCSPYMEPDSLKCGTWCLLSHVMFLCSSIHPIFTQISM